MPLEDPSVIDMGIKEDGGRLALVITDSGMTTDPDERLRMLLAKLRTYAEYVTSNEFSAEHPGSAVENVGIRVMCAVPPTEQMKGMTHVTPTCDVEIRIPIEFVLFPGNPA